MKKIISLLLTAAILFSLAACGGGSESADDPFEDTDAILTITKADGTTETLTIDELQEIESENEMNYNNNYLGCEAEVEGKVYSIDIINQKILGNVTADTAEFRLGMAGVKFWIVPGADEYKDVDLDSLKKGSIVKVKGTIGKNHVSMDLEDAHDLEIVSA